MKKIILLIGMSLFLVSCSDDTSSDTNVYPTKLVKKQYYLGEENDEDETGVLDFYYGSNNLWTNKIDNVVNSEVGGVDNTAYRNITYTYDENNRIIERYEEESDWDEIDVNTNTITYAYENERLSTMNYDGFFGMYFEYQGNVINLRVGDAEGLILATLETNSQGFVTKADYDGHYANILYDNQNNISEIDVIDDSEEVIAQYFFTYDNNPNPFYGQLTSIYLDRIYWLLREADEETISITGLNAHKFPYMKNNIVSMEKQSSTQFENQSSFNYQYDSENYPVDISESSTGSTTVYHLEYY